MYITHVFWEQLHTKHIAKNTAEGWHVPIFCTCVAHTHVCTCTCNSTHSRVLIWQINASLKLKRKKSLSTNISFDHTKIRPKILLCCFVAASTRIIKELFPGGPWQNLHLMSVSLNLWINWIRPIKNNIHDTSVLH